MTGYGFVQLLAYLACLLLLASPLGNYMARVYSGEDTILSRWLNPVEQWIYRWSRVDAKAEMRWADYATALLVFNCFGALSVFALQRWQADLPLNPQHLPAVRLDSALNTALSFASNTDWQAYGGEASLSYLTQMLGLTVQNFVSAASGMATLVAFTRGFVRHNAHTLGNFWVDLTRSLLHILLPLSLLLALALAGQGVVQTLSPYQNVSLVETLHYEQPRLGADGQPLADASAHPLTQTLELKEQILALGPAASQIAIKQLGSNGGGFFNANSAHPFENPTPLANFMEMLALLLIPAALCLSFGQMIGDRRQGWAILAAMLGIFLPLVLVAVTAEQTGNPALSGLGLDAQFSELQPGGNMEGKEIRFGIANSALWAVATTAASNGSVNAMHDSFTPLGGMVPLCLMQMGEVVFGGVGSGLYGMIVFAMLAVFVAGLMIGRTPEYLGKKIDIFEMKMAVVVILIPPLLVLAGTALAVMLEAGRSSVFNPGPHGFSEILYAFSSASNNNGSAFGGLSANTPFYNLALGLAMLLGRFCLILPVLAMAGSLAAKHIVPVSLGTLPTHGPLFVALLMLTVLVVGALTFVPALALGPVVEQLTLLGLK